MFYIQLSRVSRRAFPEPDRGRAVAKHPGWAGRRFISPIVSSSFNIIIEAAILKKEPESTRTENHFWLATCIEDNIIRVPNLTSKAGVYAFGLKFSADAVAATRPFFSFRI